MSQQSIGYNFKKITLEFEIIEYVLSSRGEEVAKIKRTDITDEEKEELCKTMGAILSDPAIMKDTSKVKFVIV